MRPHDPPALNAADRQRLAAILGRLGSDHAGERDAAALTATRFLRTRDLQWSDVIGAPALPPRQQPASLVLVDWPARWRGAVQLCLTAVGLTEWQREFLHTIATYAHRPSSRQLEILKAIAEHVLGAGGVP
jgi:hypothetical protein